MIITMNDSHITNINQIKEFVKINEEIKFKGQSRSGKYQWTEEVLNRFRYFRLSKKDKSTVRKYIIKMTGYSDAQLTRLINKKKKIGKIIAKSTGHHKFSTIYTPLDIGCLIDTDELHERLAGPATKKILEREYKIFGRQEYKNIADISSSHIYNLRTTRQYKSHSTTFLKTRPAKVDIGERIKPEPEGKPGYIRVDTVHQGNLGKNKGIYYINLVDEVTQWEIVATVEKITEIFLVPVLETLLNQYPFVIKNFHSDNGSEYINKIVADLLNKLLIKQTKSRARHCNDNALVEGKNGSRIRKIMGYPFISQRYAPRVNKFCQNYLNIYLNYHRPCGFATTITDKKGKQKKIYNTYQVPYERLKSLPEAEKYLKDGVTFAQLDKIAYEKSDNQFAALMQKAKQELFKSFNYKLQLPTTYISQIIRPNFVSDSVSISGSYED